MHAHKHMHTHTQSHTQEYLTVSFGKVQYQQATFSQQIFFPVIDTLANAQGIWAYMDVLKHFPQSLETDFVYSLALTV